MDAAGIWNRVEPTADSFSVVVSTGIAFVLLALSLMLILFISRVRKTQRQKRGDSIRDRAQGILNALIVNDTFGGQAESSFEYRMHELKTLAGTSGFDKNVIIQLLLQIRKNLSGSSSSLLKKIYHDLHLHKHSLRKLTGFTRKEQAMGIRELTEMEHNASAPLIAKFLRSRNSVLREESFMAMVRLELDKPFWFLDAYRGEITPWMQLNIHTFLQKQDARTLPDFSRWFVHKNKSVQLFSIAMTAQFRQTASAQKLLVLANDSSSEIAAAAIDALAVLEAFEFFQPVLKLLSEAHDEKIIVSSIRTLGKIGEPETTLRSFEKFLTHSSYTIRYETVLAVKALGQQSFNELKMLNQSHQLKLDEMIAHFEEPLLQ